MKTVLVVEDDERIQDLFSEFIRGRGHRVHTAQDGQAAVEAARKTHFDLVLMDVKLPTRDGFSAAEEIRVLSPGTDVVLVTGYRPGEALTRAAEAGVVTCLRKPVLFKDLEAVLDRPVPGEVERSEP